MTLQNRQTIVLLGLLLRLKLNSCFIVKIWQGKTRQEIIKEARQLHGDRYDYFEVEYIKPI